MTGHVTGHVTTMLSFNFSLMGQSPLYKIKGLVHNFWVLLECG